MMHSIPLAEAFHPSVFIKEEMKERGYTLYDVVFRMKRYESAMDWQIQCLAVEMYLEVGPTDKDIHLGDMAEGFATAFGVSSELFSNLETSWREKAMVSDNSMQRVRQSSCCFRCGYIFNADEYMSSQEQDAAVTAHRAEKHPNWMTEPLTAAQQARLKDLLKTPDQRRIEELEKELADLRR